jgi:sugar-specific transcriptional regulator TrmB
VGWSREAVAFLIYGVIITDIMTNAISEIHSDLIKIGLTEKEAKLYVGALQTSTFSLAEISKLSGIKRPTCYLIIENLLKKSLIARVPDSRSARYIIVEPHIVLEREQDKLKETEKMVKLMAQIRSRDDKQEVPHVELFHGIAGVKQIFSTILNDSPKSLYGIVNPSYIRTYLGEEFVSNWVSLRVKKGIKRFALQQRKYLKFDSIKNSKEQSRETRILPDDFDHDSIVQIWNNKVGFISDKREGISFIVESDEFSKLMKGIFDTVWKVSEEL